MTIKKAYYFNLSHDIISLTLGLFPVLSIPNLKSFDENKITRYKLNNKTNIIESTSITLGSVEFNRKSITGTEVKGK